MRKKSEFRLFDFFYHQRDKNPLPKSVGGKVDGKWVYYSTEEVIQLSLQLASGLYRLGLKPGDKIAIVTYENRPEWMITDLALLQAGFVSIPVYPTISPAEYQYIFEEAEVKCCFVGSGDLATKVQKAQKQLPLLQHIFAFDEGSAAPFWKTVMNNQRVEEVVDVREGIQPESLATIIYTSGTTGKPKGVMLSHRNIASAIFAVEEHIPNFTAKPVLCFLPLCHVFERAILYNFHYYGAEIHFTGLDDLLNDFETVKPYFFTAVPRLLEKVYERIYQKGLELSSTRQKVFFWALGLTEDFEYGKQYPFKKRFQRALADRLVFRKIRARLGGRLIAIVTGSAPCNHQILRFFSAAGIPVREGYGLTETSPFLSCNHLEESGAMIGTVGPVIRGVDVRIDASEGDYNEGEGEVLVRGANVMMGYYKKPTETAAAFKEISGQKWLRTGDVGKMIAGKNNLRFLQITDRIKQLLKTSGGKYVAPAPIENKLKSSFLIEHAMVVGEGRKFVSGLIVPAEEGVQNWCKNNGVAWTSMKDLVKNQALRKAFQEVVDKVNEELGQVEKLKKFFLIPDEWEPQKADGSPPELTPTMKLKRQVVLKKYFREVEQIYKI